jgi:hypothetical protein
MKKKIDKKSLGAVSLSTVHVHVPLELQGKSEFRTWSRKILFFGRVGGCMFSRPMYI